GPPPGNDLRVGAGRCLSSCPDRRRLQPRWSGLGALLPEGLIMTTAEQFLSAQETRAIIARDRWGRPLIGRPDGTIGAYTRASTLGKALEDGAGLTKWLQRMAVIGVASRKDLVLAVNAHRHDKDKIAEIVEQGMQAAESSAAATTGTALHELCDQYDQGQTPYVPDEFAADVQAYLAATAT